MKYKKSNLFPLVRFKEFKESWVVKPASELFINSRAKGNDRLPIYSVTLTNGMVPRESIDRKLEGDAAAEDHLFVAKSDISYNMMRMWQGAFGLAPVDCMVSPAYVVLHPNDGVSSDFFVNNFNRKRNLYLFTAYSYGVTSDRLRLYFKDFAKIHFGVPKYSEQRKIASFLSVIDERLLQSINKKQLLEQYKKGLIQQLFSGVLRFKDENGKAYPKWEETTIGQIATIKKGKGISKADITENGKLECIRYGELYTHYSERITQIYSRTNLDRSNLVLSGINDVIIPSSGETPLEIARAACVLKKDVALGGDLNILSSNQDGVFLSYYINHALKHKIAKVAQGNSVVHLYPRQLESLKLMLPTLSEQTKLANFIGSIDDHLLHLTNQIAQIQTFKKGLLQQMFV